MALPITIPYTFANATSSIPLSNLDTDFTTVANAINGIGNGTVALANVVITGGIISNVSGLSTSSIANGTSNVSIATANGSVVVATAGTTAMTVDTSQNVGIGTTSPLTRLDVVNGTSSIRGSALFNSSSNAGTGSSAYIRSANAFSSATTPDYAWWFNDQCGFFHPSTNVIGFSTAGTETMRIDSSGNLLVGLTTTDPIGVRVNGTFIGNPGNGLQTRGSSGNFKIGLNATSGTSLAFYTDSGSAYVSAGYISSSGSTTAYNTSSDYRLKENVAPMTTGLATVAALKPVIYDWVSDKSAGEGFIAHELAEVIPLAVTGEKDAVDKDGSIKPQGVDYSKIVVHLVAAIQELSAKNDALEARLAKLETV